MPALFAKGRAAKATSIRLRLSRCQPIAATTVPYQVSINSHDSIRDHWSLKRKQHWNDIVAATRTQTKTGDRGVRPSSSRCRLGRRAGDRPTAPAAGAGAAPPSKRQPSRQTSSDPLVSYPVGAFRQRSSRGRAALKVASFASTVLRSTCRRRQTAGKIMLRRPPAGRCGRIEGSRGTGGGGCKTVTSPHSATTDPATV